MNKTLMAIGAGEEQVYSIGVAKDLGFSVVAVDGYKNAKGFELADFSYCFDIRNKERLLQIAKKHNISGVIPSPVGRILYLTGFINDQLGLKGISEKAANLCTDKRQLYEILGSELPLPRQVAVEAKNRDSLTEIINDLSLPLILKPSEGSGSRGIVSIRDYDEILFAIDIHTKSISNNEVSLIEELIIGTEYGISGFVQNNIFQIVLIRKKEFTPIPFNQEIKYKTPSGLSKEIYLLIQDELQLCIDKIGLNDCLIQADIIIDDKNQFWLIEISGRPSGHSVSSLIIPNVCGISFIKLGIDLILGKSEPLKIKEKASEFGFFDFVNKKVEKVPSETELNTIRHLIDYKIKFKEGDFLGEIRNGADASNRGYYFICNEIEDEVSTNVHNLKNMFKVQ